MNNFFKEVKEWFNSNWVKNFEYKSDSEIIEKLKFDKMRLLYEITKNDESEKEKLYKSILEKISLWRNELKYQKINYYTLRFIKKKTYKFLQIEICYILNGDEKYHVYERHLSKERYNTNFKYIMNEQELKKYIAEKNSREFKLMKSS